MPPIIRSGGIKSKAQDDKGDIYFASLINVFILLLFRSKKRREDDSEDYRYFAAKRRILSSFRHEITKTRIDTNQPP